MMLPDDGAAEAGDAPEPPPGPDGGGEPPRRSHLRVIK
jgi:stringent starvation protein B